MQGLVNNNPEVMRT